MAEKWIRMRLIQDDEKSARHVFEGRNTRTMRAILVRLRDRLLGVAKITSRIERVASTVRKTGLEIQKVRQLQEACKKEIESLRQTLEKKSAVLDTRSIHERSRNFWVHSECTIDPKDPRYDAAPEYTTVLREQLLSKVGHVARALDIGCGSGDLAFHFGAVADEVIAFDISPSLINQAQREAKRRGVRNIKFSVADLEAGIPLGPFGLIACVGVTITIIDEEPFIQLIGRMSRTLEVGGFLITRDSLIKSGDGIIKDTEAKIRNYRSVTGYENAFKERGFKLVEKVEMNPRTSVSIFYLWVKKDSKSIEA
jgi:SAM-dependent methyltransferase